MACEGGSEPCLGYGAPGLGGVGAVQTWAWGLAMQPQPGWNHTAMSPSFSREGGIFLIIKAFLNSDN